MIVHSRMMRPDTLLIGDKDGQVYLV